MDWVAIGIHLAKIGLVIGAVMTLAALLTWAERKQSAYMQDRYGPERAAIAGFTLWGLFHPIADGIKMITKEDHIPERANPVLHTLAPFLAMFPALVVFAVIPFGPTLNLFGREIPLQVADLNVGLLVIFALASLSVYGYVIGGWSSHNNYSLLGGLRAASQMISYEVAMGLGVIGVLMVYGAIRIDAIVAGQGPEFWRWGVVLQPLAFIIFFVAAVAETKRAPFDLPEAESELVAGYFTEYSGMKFGMFYMGEFVEVIVLAALITTLFFGGYHLPFLYGDGFHFPLGLTIAMPGWLVILIQVGTFVLKVLFFCWFQLLIRWTLPRFRYDQLMRLGWKVLLPLALINIFVTGAVILMV